MKFASSHLRSKYFTAKLFHMAKPYFTRRRRISLKKALAIASAFFWWRRWGSQSASRTNGSAEKPRQFRLKTRTPARFLRRNPLGFDPQIIKKIKNTKPKGFVFFIGGDGGDRTHDLLNAIQALSQLSYAPKLFSIIIIYRNLNLSRVLN